MQRICIFDIDGVLNYYPDCWVEFVNEKLIYEHDFADLYQVKNELSYKQYSELKEEYRTSGYKENLKVRPDAFNTLLDLKNQGFYIIILSSRPVDEYNSLIMQTTTWLRKNGLIYDYLIFDHDKHLEIIKKFGDVEFVVEDNRHYANSIAKHGYKVYLVNNAYNQGEIESLVERISSVHEISGRNANA